LHRLLSNNVKADPLHDALRDLEEAGHIESRDEPTDTKPTMAWRALTVENSADEEYEQYEEPPPPERTTGESSYSSYCSSKENADDPYAGGEEGIL
jgi:hypothetical protein